MDEPMHRTQVHEQSQHLKSTHFANPTRFYLTGISWYFKSPCRAAIWDSRLFVTNARWTQLPTSMRSILTLCMCTRTCSPKMHSHLFCLGKLLTRDVSKKLLCNCFTAASASEEFLRWARIQYAKAKKLAILANPGAHFNIFNTKLKSCQGSWSQWRQSFWIGHLLSSCHIW
jgi:hypothetical protein